MVCAARSFRRQPRSARSIFFVAPHPPTPFSLLTTSPIMRRYRQPDHLANLSLFRGCNTQRKGGLPDDAADGSNGGRARLMSTLVHLQHEEQNRLEYAQQQGINAQCTQQAYNLMGSELLTREPGCAHFLRACTTARSRPKIQRHWCVDMCVHNGAGEAISAGPQSKTLIEEDTNQLRVKSSREQGRLMLDAPNHLHRQHPAARILHVHKREDLPSTRGPCGHRSSSPSDNRSPSAGFSLSCR